MKSIDRAALVLIVLALISTFGTFVIRRLAYLSPNLQTLPNFTTIFAVLTGVVSLTMSIGIGSWLAKEARQDGRSPWIWFLFGFMFNLIGMIAYLLLPIYEERKSRLAAEAAQRG